jgi:hypothetical protein
MPMDELFMKSGSIAKGLRKEGRGLGLYQAKQLLAINRADPRLYFEKDAAKDGHYRENILDIVFLNP